MLSRIAAPRANSVDLLHHGDALFTTAHSFIIMKINIRLSICNEIISFSAPCELNLLARKEESKSLFASSK